MSDFLSNLYNPQLVSTNAPGTGQGMLLPSNINNFQTFGNPLQLANAAASGGGDSWFSMSKLFGNDKQLGSIPAIAGIGSSLMNGFLGWNQYNLAKDKFNFDKAAYNKNYANEVASYNTQIADRANARASATGDFAGAQEYINRNRLA